ncbi:MAG: methyltransferase domain-containing protein [Chloroflexota bacterium]|nr:MAG: methyltransferase domain-containing protein [Chloroflexota bacterium]
MPQPGCSCCYDEAFDADFAASELRLYRRRGPGRASKALADALSRPSVAGLTVLDIGGGVGAVHHLLLERGASSATDIDASSGYLAAAQEAAASRGLTDRVTFRHGDFVALAADIEPADLVALDRVVCCYPDVDALVGRAAERTRRRLAITIPPDIWVARLVIRAINVWEWVTRSDLRIHAHPHERVRALARAAGLVPVSSTPVGSWRLLVFERPILTSDSR